LIHCADLGNPAKPVPLAAEWAKRITEEQFIQGDEEKTLGVTINPLGDRDQVCLGKCQVSKTSARVHDIIESNGSEFLYYQILFEIVVHESAQCHSSNYFLTQV
jgi:hypothetical protein